MKPLFSLGHVVATPGALAAIGVSGYDLSTYLARHPSGDWGDIDAHDRRENQLSIEQGFRLMSAYTLGISGAKIWIITEADRSSTCILLPEEYWRGLKEPRQTLTPNTAKRVQFRGTVAQFSKMRPPHHSNRLSRLPPHLCKMET